MELSSVAPKVVEAPTEANVGPARESPLPVEVADGPRPTAGDIGARLTLRRGGALSQEVFAIGTGPSVIGRFDPETGPVDVDLGMLPEAVYISRNHAEIWSDRSGRWLIKDLGSGNGTFICAVGERQFRRANGESPIQNGDQIALGNARFEFRLG
jgi:pSer/pThr/pTyr-binding forkhead associated (FHA) protein